MLVIGEMDPKFYDPVFLAMVSRGMSPTIVTISATLSTEGDFRDLVYQHTESKDVSVESMEARIRFVQQGIIGSTFGKASVSNVRCVVWGLDTINTDGDASMAWLMDIVPENHAEYRLTVGGDGSLYLDGNQYGRIEIPSA